MQRFKDIIIVVLFVALMWVWRANAGIPGGPDTEPASTNWYTIQAIYERLDKGTAGSKSGFTEPSATPGTGTMHTLNDVMGKAPALDTNGASQAEVVSGKTFWGLTSGEWGKKSGTMVNQGSKSYTPNASEQTIMAGYYDGTGKVEGDSDLAAGNIKKDVEIFGVTGTFEAGSASSAPVPDTGQTICYDDSGSTVSCSGSGQDGELQKGVDWPKLRFTDNSDGTVTDNLTGLIWLKDADCMGAPDWQTALTNIGQSSDSPNTSLNSGKEFSCDDYTKGTFDDWRLPNLKELQSLLHYGFLEPALSNAAGTAKWTEGDPFTGVQPDFYWSSTTYLDIKADGWVVGLYDGVAVNDDKVSGSYVWPVRGGQ